MSKPFEMNAPVLWQWTELTQGLLNQTLQGPDVTGVVADSRNIQPGQLFIALPGDPGPRFNPSYRSSVDGHSFVAAAAAAGAAGALVHKNAGALQVDRDFPLLEVEDTYDGLWALGHLARERLTGQVVAITGSSGKTTAKHFISAALEAYAPPGSFNNHIGVPLSLANTPAHSKYAVFEVGTNHPGEIEPLAQMIKPDVAVLLNVQSAHIENFADCAALKDEKVSIFNALADKSNAVSDYQLGLNHGLTFGIDRDADACVINVQGDLATLHVFGKTVLAQVPGGGLHRATTIAATLLVCHLLGQDMASACQLPHSLIPNGRGNIIKVGQITLVDDSYNANPDSMLAALASLSSNTPGHSQGGNRIAVIGEMLELGDASGAGHLGLAEPLADMDHVFCVGQGARNLAQRLNCAWYESADDTLLQDIIQSCDSGSTVLVKGSNRVFWANHFVQRLEEALKETNVSRVTT